MENKESQKIQKIIEALYPYNYGVVGKESFEAITTYKKFLNFRVSHYKSGLEMRGWKIPNGWVVKKATIKNNGIMLHNCIEKTKLGCAYLSPEFKGLLSKKELINHCAFREDLPNATVYDWTRLYRQDDMQWGLSIPWTKIKAFPEDNLQINIKTEEYESEMIVYDYLVKGKNKSEIVISAHNCHPYQANDDISGCAVAINLIKNIRKRKNLKYSYRIILGPELFGPMFWLEEHKAKAKNMIGCILLKSVGNTNSIHMQKSYNENSYINKVMQKAMEDNETNSNVHKFRTYYGNDETVFDAVGVEIPTVTLTRFPFEEYHTDLDTPENISENALDKTNKILAEAINIFETNREADNI